MKTLENLFELSNYDSKNITNKGSIKIPEDALRQIETEGVTMEFLLNLKAPVFKYRTQITIHGIFDELKHNYIGGYKNLFQNKNLSIGVRWQAVDYNKKNHIYKTVCSYLNQWRRQFNSQEFFIYKISPYFDIKEQYQDHLQQAKDEIQHINRSLFFGNSGVYLSRTLYGRYFLVSYINIGGILESNVTPCIENICQADIDTINAKLAADKAAQEAREAERKAQYEKEIADRKAKQQPILDKARKVLIQAGYILETKTPIENDKIYIRIETDIEAGNFNFVAHKFYKEPRQKKFREIKATSETLTFQFPSTLYRRETLSETFSGYVKQQPKPIQPVIPETTQRTAVNPKTNGIEIVNYSEKAIAVFGDTRYIKDRLKAAGGRFNPFLNHKGTRQAGWIFQAAKRTELETLMKLMII